jgi:hypothetical protein
MVQLENFSKNEEECCRICLDDDIRDNLIAPCACSGSSKWVHRECLDRWRTMNEDRAFARCTECLTDYTLISVCEDTAEVRARREKSYYLHVFRDFGLMFLLSQGVIALFSMITYYCK